LDEERQGSTEVSIQSDARLTEAQRQALLTILRSFLADNAPAAKDETA
jgi:hypothetical protein